MRNIIPRADQRSMIEWIIDHPRCCIFAKPGTGKTSAALMAIDIMRVMGELHRAVPVLVIAPPRVAHETWPNEAAKWDNLRHAPVVPICGTPAQRRAILDTVGRVPGGIYSISYELLPWLSEEEEGRTWPFRCVVSDESHHLRGFRLGGARGVRARAVARIAHSYVDRWINLTGTPQPRDMDDLWGQMWFVDRGARLERTHSAFVSRYMMFTHPGQQRPQMRPGVAAEIFPKLADVCLTVEPPAAPEPIVRQVDVVLPPDAAKVYADMHRQMVAELKEFGALAAFNEGSKTVKCMQIANGGVYTRYPAYEHVHDAKVNALEDVLDELNEPVLIVYEYKFEIALIKRAAPGAALLVEGKNMDAFKRGEIERGIIHPASCGEGLDGLQNYCRSIIFFGHNWRLDQRIQTLERIGPQRQKAAGHDRPVFVWDLIATRTIDEIIMKRHATRRAAMELLMEAFIT